MTCFDEEKAHYTQELRHTESASQILWQLKATPIVNMRVSMRMGLYLQLGDAGIALSGNPVRVPETWARRRVYTSNDPKLQLDIKYPVMVTFHDVPVGNVVGF